MMLFSIFLVGGLIVSIQAGGETSQLVMKQASKAGVAIRSFAGRTVTSGVQGSKPYRAIGKKLTQVPLLNKLGYDMLDKSDSTRMSGNIKKREKEIEENRSKDEILNTANGMAPNRMNKKAYTDYTASRNIALKKGWLKNDSKALDSVRTDIRNNNSDLNAKVICDAFPQYFRMKDGKLEEIDQGAPGYSKEVVKNLAGMNAQDLPKHTEHILEAIIKAGGDVDEFLQELVSLKTNQLTAFFNNVSEDEYNQGEKVFGGTSANPKPFQGPNGEIVKRLKAKAANALATYSNATNSNGTPTAASGLTQLEVDDLEQKWIEADQVLTVLNDKLKTSNPLQETLDTPRV